MEFVRSDPHTIGIELELQLLDPETLDLVDGIMPLMDFYPEARKVKPEFIQNTVEITTDICAGADELYADLVGVLHDVYTRCTQLNMALCASGTHPFSRRLALITPQPRYLRMEKTGGVQSYVQITFATHVHIGMESGQQAIEVMDKLRPFIPLLIAISANSPFWRGLESGFVCYRQRILAASRSYGIPPAFGSWQRCVDFFDMARRTGIFNSVHDVHWDIRPRPHLGTIEVRCFDAQSSIGDATALAAFVRALICFLKEHETGQLSKMGMPRTLAWWLERENHFQASRQGLKARCIVDEAGESKPLEEIWQQVYESITPIAKNLGDLPWLERFRRGIDRAPPYRRQKIAFERKRSFTELVSSLVGELQQDLPTAPGGGKNAGIAERS